MPGGCHVSHTEKLYNWLKELMEDNISQRKQDEEKYRKIGRLPPGQSVTLQFPVYHFGQIPSFDLTTWDFKIWGEVDSPVQLSWIEFNKLPRSKLLMDLHCVTRWSRMNTWWEGIRVKTLIENGLLTLKSSAKFVIQHAENGFTTNFPLEVALADNFLMATHFNDEPITSDHGAPLRGVIGAIPEGPELKTLYLWKGAKWLRGLEFSAVDKPGFWEQAGYHNEADVWKEQRYG
jgi:DMSO/TMAO reductase YedYZ molybdopterin-dependent catalytic subunit